MCFRIKGDGILQKLFSAFPHGWPGVGLLLLRVFVAGIVIVQTIMYIAANQITGAGWVLVVLVLTSAACLLLGVLTPIAAVLIGLASLGLAFSTAPDSLHDLEIAVLATVIVLLGPGAFSVDARMFGRREILIPSARSSKL